MISGVLPSARLNKWVGQCNALSSQQAHECCLALASGWCMGSRQDGCTVPLAGICLNTMITMSEIHLMHLRSQGRHAGAVE